MTPCSGMAANVRALGAASVLAVTLGCGATVTELRADDGRRLRIECIDAEACRERAARACGSTYVVESEWRNPIPESDLPGLNEASRPKDARDWARPTLIDQTGIESREPMPLVSLVVRCAGTSS